MPKPDVKLHYSFGNTVANAAGELETVMSVECFKKGKPLGNEEVELITSGKPVEKKKADTAGKVSFTVKCPAGTANLKGELKSLPNSGYQRWFLNIATAQAAPAKTTSATTASVTPKTRPISSSDPVELQVLRSELPKAGSFRLFARVLNIAGKGLKKRKVSFIHQGNHVEIETDTEGVCEFPPKAVKAATPSSITLRPGSETKITAFVSGISELTTTVLCRRRSISSEEKQRALANNRRARCFLIISGVAMALWLAFYIGWGEPLLGSHGVELTAQEKFFNTIPGVVETGHEVRKGSNSFQILGLIALFAAFSVLYGIIASREEVSEAVRTGVSALVDKHYVRAQDPFFDRLAAWTGQLSRAMVPAVPQAAPAPTGASEAKPVKTRFWDHFRSDLLSDFAIEIAPRIFRAVFTGRR